LGISGGELRSGRTSQSGKGGHRNITFETVHEEQSKEGEYSASVGRRENTIPYYEGKRSREKSRSLVEEESSDKKIRISSLEKINPLH